MDTGEEQQRRAEFIEVYIPNFMATVDANRLDFFIGEVLYPCTYDQALKAAEAAWLIFKEQHQ